MITYVIAGVLDSGKYGGYHLIVAYEDSGGMDTETYFFATKDFKTFILDDSGDSAGQTAQTYTAGEKFNTIAVVKADDISFEVPPRVIDEGNFALINEGFNMGNFLSLATASSAPVLASNSPGLFFFGDTSGSGWYGPGIPIAVETTEGLVFDYALVSKESDTYAAVAASSTLPTSDRSFYKKTDLITSTSTYENYGGAWLQGSLNQDDVVPVAKTRRGVQLYAFKATDNLTLRQGYGSTITEWVKESGTPATTTIPKFINNVRVPVPIPTFEQYVAQHPILFLQDPWGRWIGLEEMDYPNLTDGGKGKPVIYLYPTKTERVSVEVDPIGGFTKTDPAYHNGWDVMATPDSVLTNLSDGKTYPYLFWEGGAKGIVKTPTEGFVVAQAGIPALLTDKLALLGLNAKERADFISFWVPRLSKAPYYFITFVPKSEMDRVAPLTVTPSPDTVIRVLMDYKALSAPVSVKPLQITTPVRTGFTIVEWGGIIRD